MGVSPVTFAEARAGRPCHMVGSRGSAPYHREHTFSELEARSGGCYQVYRLAYNVDAFAAARCDIRLLSGSWYNFSPVR